MYTWQTSSIIVELFRLSIKCDNSQLKWEDRQHFNINLYRKRNGSSHFQTFLHLKTNVFACFHFHWSICWTILNICNIHVCQRLSDLQGIHKVSQNTAHLCRCGWHWGSEFDLKAPHHICFYRYAWICLHLAVKCLKMVAFSVEQLNSQWKIRS